MAPGPLLYNVCYPQQKSAPRSIAEISPIQRSSIVDNVEYDRLQEYVLNLQHWWEESTESFLNLQIATSD
mgnify:CR=1 FL=1